MDAIILHYHFIDEQTETQNGHTHLCLKIASDY